MAKNIIEKAPFEFTHSTHDIGENFQYLAKYREVDSKGRYLYWDKFKYRVEEGDDSKIAWWATKWARFSNAKHINYRDKNDKLFTFCVPDALQAKLSKISSS